MVISDNGASAEGGPTGTTNEAQFFNNAPEPFEDSLAAIDEIGGPKYFNHYPWGWTWAGNTPFRRWKRETYRGGVSDPFIVCWPKGIAARGEVREQYAHAIDMVPTVLDVLGIEPPATIRGVPQSPLHGTSLAHTFDDPAAAERAHDPVLRDDGPPVDLPRRLAGGVPVAGPVVRRGRRRGSASRSPRTKLAELDATGWELYHVAEDPAECHNLAAEHRDRLIALIATWYVEAGKYDVMPVDGSGVARMAGEKPLIAAPRDRFVYYPGTQSVPFFAGPRVLNRPHSITADVEIPEAGAEGVLLAQGTSAGGFTFYVKDRPAALHAQLGRPGSCCTSRPTPSVSAGRHELRFEFEPTGMPDPAKGHGSPGRLQLYIDGELVGDREVPFTTPFAFNPGALTCGADPGSTGHGRTTTAPFRFTGTIHTVTVDLSGELISDPEAELEVHMARQ